MPPLHSRSSLEAMKRVDLQRLCKEYGVKANLKTEDLIDLLLDSQTPAPPRATPGPRSTPQPQPTRRSVSIKPPSKSDSNRAGPSRVSSMIVHEDSEEDNEEDEAQASETESEKPPSPPPVPPPRTRKAKELQTKLGKGKPVLAGGSGPRAITASSGSSKGKRAKSSRSIKPREPTIEEEPEVLSVPKFPEVPPETETQPLGEPSSPEGIKPSRTFIVHDPFPSTNDSIQTLLGQIQSLRAELTQIATMKIELVALKGQMADIDQTQREILTEVRSLRELPAMVAALKEDVKALRDGSQPSRPTTPKPKPGQTRPMPIGFGLPSVLKHSIAFPPEASSRALGPSTAPLLHPGVSPSTLGKRHRDSSSSIIDGVIEEGQQEDISDAELAKIVLRHDKKRAKVSTSLEHTPTNGFGKEEDGDESSPRGSSNFTVYQGTDEQDLPPPTSHLPEIYVVDSPSESSAAQGSRSTSGVPTSSAHASENQPFNFAFSNMTSTPQNMFMSGFPYPEPPQSPSPAGPSLPQISGRHQEERTDIFKEFGLPSPVRSVRNYGVLAHDERGINPAALQGTSTAPKRNVSSDEVAAGLGLTAHRTTSSSDPPSTEAPAVRRTMYGTELDGDTRFGDFGVEGVASGFWLSK
ncbi:hypothetical protein CPB83DRAFT_848281 [Crepidotus variabilis]|uniref:SAP domain-containing protein n=1 Tax=Crepidotus variabilis TaxID=179855 RepID=A0A9P6ELM8_9AGAR|nr:hypothetical protein CPB83DRAFT_848281 [Crepidotus variabilis]